MKREMLRHKSRKVLFIENRYKVTIYCTVYSRYARTINKDFARFVPQHLSRSLSTVPCTVDR